MELHCYKTWSIYQCWAECIEKARPCIASVQCGQFDNLVICKCSTTQKTFETGEAVVLVKTEQHEVKAEKESLHPDCRRVRQPKLNPWHRVRLWSEAWLGGQADLAGGGARLPQPGQLPHPEHVDSVLYPGLSGHLVNLHDQHPNHHSLQHLHEYQQSSESHQ